MKVNRIISLFGAASALLFAACTSDELRDTLPSDGAGVPLEVRSAAISYTASGIGTRVVADEVDRALTTDGDAIGLFRKEEGGKYAAIYNRKYSYATPFWSAEEQLLLNDADAILTAYWPYSSSRAANPVLLRSQQYSLDEDLCYKPFGASNTSSTVTLKLSHVYSRLRFNLKAVTSGDESYVGAGSVTRLAFNAPGLRPVAMFDLYSPSVAGITDLPGMLPGMDIALTGVQFDTANGSQTVVDCLMIPTTLSGDFAFTFTIDGKPMKGSVAATALCGIPADMERGLVYEINITVKASMLVIESVKMIKEWDLYNNGNEIPGQGN